MRPLAWWRVLELGGQVPGCGEGSSHSGVPVEVCDGPWGRLFCERVKLVDGGVDKCPAGRAGLVLFTELRTRSPWRVIPGPLRAQRASLACPGCGGGRGWWGATSVDLRPPATGAWQTGGGAGLQVRGELEELYRARGFIQEESTA